MSKPIYEYIGNGACGCIISDPNNSENVYKLFRDEKERDTEYATYQAIHDITKDFTLKAFGTKQFFRKDLGDKLVEKCEVFDLEGDNEDDYDEFDEDDAFTTQEQSKAHQTYIEALKEENEKLKQLPIHAIQYERGGIDLEKASTTIKFSIIFTDMHFIFSGLIELDTKGWVHCDIKPANIVYAIQNFKNAHFALIDFGSAFKFSKIKEKSETSLDWELYTSLRVPYSFFPPELPEFAAKLKQNDPRCTANDRPRDQNYRTLLSTLEYHKKKMSTKNPRIIEYINIISTFIDRCELYIKYTILNANIPNFETNKIDVYMLGVTLLDVMLKSMYHDKYDIKDEEITSKVIKLILRMLNPKFTWRYDIKTTCFVYNRILELINTAPPPAGGSSVADFAIAVSPTGVPLINVLAKISKRYSDRIIVFVKTKKQQVNCQAEIPSNMYKNIIVERSHSDANIAKHFATGTFIIKLDDDTVKAHERRLNRYISKMYKRHTRGKN